MPGNSNLQLEGRRLSAAERRPKVVALRRQGLSAREITARFNVSHVTVLNDLNAAYTRFAEEESEETRLLRELEGLRLDRLQQAVWPAAITGDAGRSWQLCQSWNAALVCLVWIRRWCLKHSFTTALSGN